MKKTLIFLLFFFVTHLSITTGEENNRDYSLKIKDSLPIKYQIFWEPGYDAKEAKQIKRSCDYNKIKMQRTPCFGACPVYSIEFTINGDATYDGVDFVKRKGKYRGEVFLIHYGKLCYLIDEYLKKYKDADFRAGWTCDAECIITLELKDGKTLEIYDYGSQGPIELWALQNSIDGLSEKIDWKQIKQST